MSAFGAALSAVVLALAAIVVWLFARKRSAAAGTGALVVGALLVAGCFLPPGTTRTVSDVAGTLTGSARIPVLATNAAPRLTNATLANGTTLVVECPAGCSFAMEPGALALDAGGVLSPQLHGGPLDVGQLTTVCHHDPPTLRALTLGDTCDPCAYERFESSGADGMPRIQGIQGLC